jgi:signal transduction histidine kinase
VKDGLQANEFNQGAYFAARNGELFFGGVNGFNSFFPESINDNDYIPPIYLTTFKIFDKPLQNPGSLASLNDIELSYSQNFFSFEFVALNYTTPEKNQYAYMLEGFDKDWHIVTAQQRYGSYTNLDPGEYKLRIKGSNNDGIWNEAGISVAVIVTPPFWMTWWFRTLGVIMVLSSIYIIYQNRINSLKQEKELQQKISHRLIEKQEEERRRIALEMHDSLGHSLLFIKNRANLTAKKSFDVTSASENFNQISAAASEALITVREISHNLRPPELDQLGLSETLRSILISFRESTSIKINGAVEDIDGLIPKELDINVVRILQEALSNIIKHSGAAECEILVTKSESQITINISDYGKGFEQNNTQYSRRETPEKKHAGLGLAGMTERVRILNGNFKIESTPGKGTHIEIKIPLNR